MDGNGTSFQTPKDPSTPNKPGDGISANIPKDKSDPAGGSVVSSIHTTPSNINTSINAPKPTTATRSLRTNLNLCSKHSPHPTIMEEASNNNDIES